MGSHLFQVVVGPLALDLGGFQPVAQVLEPSRLRPVDKVFVVVFSSTSGFDIQVRFSGSRNRCTAVIGDYRVFLSLFL